jgi:hypothetical protein
MDQSATVDCTALVVNHETGTERVDLRADKRDRSLVRITPFRREKVGSDGMGRAWLLLNSSAPASIDI